MPNGSKHYCFTLNNPSGEEAVALATLGTSPNIRYLVVGRETGDSGTPHLQGYVCFQVRKTIAAAKQLLGNRAHLEVKRGTVVQASDYCKKDADFDEYGTLPTGRGVGSAWAAFNTFLTESTERPSTMEIASEFPGLFGQYPQGIRRFLDLHFPNQIPRPQGSPREWQRDLAERLSVPPDDRTVVFVVDPVGGHGKTWLVQHLLHEREDVQVLKVGKRDDLAYCIDIEKSVFLFDVPRSGMEFFQYTVCEMLKDKMVFSPKYESQMKCLSHDSHVIVFCNEYPDRSKLSDDRYDVIELSDVPSYNILT